MSIREAISLDIPKRMRNRDAHLAAIKFVNEVIEGVQGPELSKIEKMAQGMGMLAGTKLSALMILNELAHFALDDLTLTGDGNVQSCATRGDWTLHTLTHH